MNYIIVIRNELNNKHLIKGLKMETMNYKGYDYTIEQDTMGDSREWDNLGTMICTHRRYNLGDTHRVDFSNCNSWQEYRNAIVRKYGIDCIILPLYLMDHSGLSISTTSYNDRWDSGRIGYIVVSREKARKELGVKRISSKTKNQILNQLKGEVKTYNQDLTGDVWYFQITKGNEEIDACGGMYGYDETVKEIESTIDYMILQEQKNTGIQMELELSVDINKMELVA